MFSDVTIQILLRSGWFQDRSIDYTVYKSFYDTINHSTYSPALHFLENFGGLVLEITSQAGYMLKFFIDPIIAWDYWHKFNFKYFEENWIGESVCIIGDIDEGDSVITMSNTGKVYLISSNWVVLMGESGTEALEELCTRGKGIPIPKKKT